MDPKKIRDKRVVERNLDRGIFSEKDAKKFKKGLKDVSHKATKTRIKVSEED